MKDEDTISCQGNLTTDQVQKVFNLASKNLNASETHFQKIQLVFDHDSADVILEDNTFGDNTFGDITFGDITFGDITFEKFQGYNIKRIGSNAFNKTANQITVFDCLFTCAIENQPPKYNIQTVFNQINKMLDLSIGLNVNEIPSNAFPIDTINSTELSYLRIMVNQNLIIKSGAFKSLNKLMSIEFYKAKISKIEKETFKLNSNLTGLSIDFINCNLTNESFQIGSFDGILKLSITFMQIEIDYFNESVFKPFF